MNVETSGAEISKHQFINTFGSTNMSGNMMTNFHECNRSYGTP